MDYENAEVADDLSDAKGLGILSWISLATLRFAASAFVTIVFVFGFILLAERFTADSALNGGSRDFNALTVQGGGLGVSEAVDDAKMANARNARDAKADWDKQAAAEQQETDQANALATRLMTLAVTAGCAVQNVEQAMTCKPERPPTATLQAQIDQTSKAYQDKVNQLIATRQDLEPAIRTYQAAAIQPGAEYVAALPAIAARDQVVGILPPVLRPTGTWFFQLPLLVSGLVTTFFAGMFGSVLVLLVLLAYPNYAPLTFGGGKYFFLRMFTGGFVAVLVFVAVGSGASVAGLADLQSIAAQGGGIDPTKIALLGVFAGAFSEQIAGAVRGYVDTVFHNVTGGSNPPPAQTPPPAEGGAMGPGAAAGQV
ncbi:MAG: hypothetical protein ABUL73_01935 [Alphaproteobacteria bacterium]